MSAIGISKSYNKYKITDKRRVVQALFLFLYFIFPFFGLFYIDLDSNSFVLLGKTIGLNNSVIFLIAFVVLLLAVVSMAIITGRSFCGWVCPQNFLSEMVNKVINKFALKSNKQKKLLPYTVITFFCLVISVMVALNFMFYFGKPVDVINQLISGDLNGVVVTFALFFCILVFCGIGIFRHDFCKYACPYGVMQASVADKTTMRVSFAKERSKDCIDCDACTDICYMDIEPRKLVMADPGCMNCGLCVEACHNVLEPIGVKSMLDFTIEKNTLGDNLNSKAPITLVVSMLFFGGLFLYMYIMLPKIDLTVSRDETMVSIIDNNGNLNSGFLVKLINQTNQKQEVKIETEDIKSGYVSYDQNNIQIEPGKKALAKLVIKAPKKDLTPGINKFNIKVLVDNQEVNRIYSSIFVPAE